MLEKQQSLPPLFLKQSFLLLVGRTDTRKMKITRGKNLSVVANSRNPSPHQLVNQENKFPKLQEMAIFICSKASDPY